MTTPGRVAQRLARLGFVHADRAEGLLSGPPLSMWDAEANAPADDTGAAVIAALSRAADPDGALDALHRLVAAQPDDALRRELGAGSELRRRLVALLGVSVPLGEHLVSHPDDWRVLLDAHTDGTNAAERIGAAVGADVRDPVTGTGGKRAEVAGDDAVAAIRDAYRRELVAVAGRDLAGDLDLGEVMAALSALAGAALQAGLAASAAALPASAGECRLAVIGMGKTGGQELNYISDVDVIFVGDGDLDTATVLASGLMRICRAAAWEVDANLRPEGKDGALVRTLASHEAYYKRWASTWEFQALLKARPVAGDPDLGAQYVRTVSSMVWTAAEREHFVADVQAMRRRVLQHLPRDIADREIKLGAGGLRDVEFAVQLLQLVHGRADEALRARGTLPALEALRDGGFVGRDDALSLRDAYRFLRATEHRLQLRRLRRTHLVPSEPAELTWLARSLGFRPDARGDARAVWEAEWALHAREVRRLHEKLFYRPLLEAVARVPTDALRLTPDEARRRLAALGFADPTGALRHIESLTGGLSRRATLQRALLPVILSYFADAPDPDGGLLAYRQVSEALGSTPWYLRGLRDEGTVAPRLAYLLGTSRYVGNMLVRAPEAMQMLADDDELVPRPAAEVRAAMADAAARQTGPEDAVHVMRGLRRQELLRTAFADLLGLSDVETVCEALTATTEATLDAALQVAARAVAAERGLEGLPFRFAVIAMGRLGGRELSYGSDADVVFVYEGDEHPEAGRIAIDLAERLRRLLSAPSSDPPLGIDANLRPEGRNGPLVRSLASYEHYYARWSAPWEAQALLRARFCAGDAGLGERFIALIDPVRYPSDGLSSTDLLEIRRIKGRVDSERLPRGADPSTHTKLGRGGLADIEWTVQLLQLSHGHDVPGLRTAQTLPALDAAVGADLLAAEEADALRAAWRLATHVRNAIMLVRDKAGDQVPHTGIALRGVGRALGYPAGFQPGELIDDYRRTARRARRVVEKVFYGSAD